MTIFDYDEEPAYDVYGVPAWTYEEACLIAGVETPAMLRLEAEWQEACDREAAMDAMEARGGPLVSLPVNWNSIDWDEIPF